MKTTTFLPADLLLPQNCDSTRWSVVASDQYTSQEDYWQDVENFVGRAPSTLRLTLPESCLDGPDIETDIMSVNGTMSEYLRGNIFESYENSMMYVERVLDNGKIRKGIVGKVDLEHYDYTPTATSRIRGAEWAVMPRIPPRVAARKNAPLELSHVILLADDDKNLIFDGISPSSLEKKYEVELMKQGGKLSGWLLGEGECKKIVEAVEKLAEESSFSEKYQTTATLLQFLMGDGNHSLATAKECYERQKKLVREEQGKTLLSRYALVELVNLHDDGVELLPIHRVIKEVNQQEFLREFRVYVEQLPKNTLESQDFSFYFGETSAVMTVKQPTSPFPVTVLEEFIAHYKKDHDKIKVKYIQSVDEAIKEGKRNNALGIILPHINKEDLFPTVIAQGILPAKTFSLGLPQHKGFYLEARRIRE